MYKRQDLKKLLLEARDLSSKIVPYVSAINLIANDFSGTAELAFDHDYGIWGEDDTTVRMPVGGVLSTIAENAATIMPVGKNISSVVKVADNLDSIIGDVYKRQVLNVFGTNLAKSDVPGASEAARWIFGRNPYNDRLVSVPIMTLVEGAAKAPGQIFRASEGEGSARAATRSFLDLVAVATGLPAGSLKKPVGYAAGVASGEICLLYTSL